MATMYEIRFGEVDGTLACLMVIARASDEAAVQLAHSVKETFGFRNVRSTAALAAPWFVGAALGLDVLSTFYAGDELLLVARLTVTPGGGLHGLQMHELAARTRVLALRRAADAQMPGRRLGRMGEVVPARAVANIVAVTVPAR